MTAAGSPSFDHRDPATAEFWTERYARSFTPWDQGGVPAAFGEALAAHPLPSAPAQVLVPGCGSGHELKALDRIGHDWLAIDLSPLAVEQARARLPVSSAMRVRVADFFDTRAAGAGFDWIYERAFLCALPPALWPRLAAHMASLLAPDGLWAGFFFVHDEPALATPRRGPPFASATAEFDALMAPWFDRVASRPIPDDQSLGPFRGHEHWIAWRLRATARKVLATSV